jgi:uncharacterized membrane protein YesL
MLRHLGIIVAGIFCAVMRMVAVTRKNLASEEARYSNISST